MLVRASASWQIDTAGLRLLDQLRHRDLAGRAGSYQGLHLVVRDLPATVEDLRGRGIAVSEPFHFGEAGQTDGLHPARADYGSYASFSDPAGNGWLLQEVASR